MIDDDLLTRARKIKLLLMDCDGVMTDGKLYFSEHGEELKVFHVRDGQGLATWHEAGFRSGIISGRDAGLIIGRRASELGMHHVRVKSTDKIRDFEDIMADTDLSVEEVAYVGDDLGDNGLLKRVGLAVCVADAVEEVKACAHFITSLKGGYGAIREITDLLLRAKRSSI
ncbi:MAG: HAD hydrolase family protein [Pyrinomonadaceae bacterium]